MTVERLRELSVLTLILYDIIPNDVRSARGRSHDARGREVTHLPHSGGAGAPPGGQYELPARSMANSGAGTARLRLRQCAKPGGRNGRLPQSAAGAVRKTPAMARHEAPAFSRGNAVQNEQWLRHLARHLPLFLRGTRETTADPAPTKNTGDDARPSERAMLFDN